jgi:hypothetical protein
MMTLSKLIHVNLRGSATHALSVRVHKVSRVPTKLVAVRSHPSRGAGRAMEHEKTGPDVAQTAFSTHEYAEFGSTEHPTPTSAHTLPHVSVVGMYDNDDYAEECSNEYANVEDSTEKLLKAKSGLDPLADDASGMSWQAAGTMVREPLNHTLSLLETAHTCPPTEPTRYICHPPAHPPVYILLQHRSSTRCIHLFTHTHTLAHLLTTHNTRCPTSLLTRCCVSHTHPIPTRWAP